MGEGWGGVGLDMDWVQTWGIDEEWCKVTVECSWQQ